MSPRAAAPRSASQIACSRTSASLWPARPLSCAISTPPITSLRPATRACTSNPWPMRTSGRVRAFAQLHDQLREHQVRGERDLDVEIVALHQARRVVADRFDRLRLVARVGLLLESPA